MFALVTLLLSASGALPGPSGSPPVPASSPHIAVRRMPDTTPRLTRGDAIIRNSGSTNTAGYTIVVHADGTADLTQDGATLHGTVAAADVRQLFATLRETADLETVGGGACMKSASFGSATTVAYQGATTLDVSCGRNSAARKLQLTASRIALQLGASAPRRRPFPLRSP